MATMATSEARPIHRALQLIGSGRVTIRWRDRRVIADVEGSTETHVVRRAPGGVWTCDCSGPLGHRTPWLRADHMSRWPLHWSTVARSFKTSRLWQVVAAMAALGVVTGVCGLGGLLGTEVTAYATAVLAFGTVGLAAGAIGTYVEQRRANQQQAGQLQRRKVADIAQVQVERLSGPDELAKIAVTNGSERAIRNVHVWVEVRGMTGHYGTGVQKDDGSQARAMSHVLHDA